MAAVELQLLQQYCKKHKGTGLYSYVIWGSGVSNGKAVSLRAWNGPEGSRKLRFPDFMTTTQDGGNVVSLTHRPPLTPGNAPGTHFCYRLSRPQGHSAIGWILWQWKIPLRPAGIEPVTFRFVAQHLNHFSGDSDDRNYILWSVTTCRLVNSYRLFGEACRCHLSVLKSLERLALIVLLREVFGLSAPWRPRAAPKRRQLCNTRHDVITQKTQAAKFLRHLSNTFLVLRNSGSKLFAE